MADQHEPKKKWITPVIRRLEGEEAERIRAIICERKSLLETELVRPKTQAGK